MSISSFVCVEMLTSRLLGKIIDVCFICISVGSNIIESGWAFGVPWFYGRCSATVLKMFTYALKYLNFLLLNTLWFIPNQAILKFLKSFTIKQPIALTIRSNDNNDWYIEFLFKITFLFSRCMFIVDCSVHSDMW